MEKKIIETNGNISKVENVHSIERNILPNTLVLENIEPYPGYHGSNLPSDKPPLSLFFITQKRYTFEEISRTTAKIRKSVTDNFNGVYGELKIFNDNYHSIRIMGLKSFERIATLQKLYGEEGFKFLKRKLINDCAIIKIQKTFLLEEIAEGIYKDMDEPGTTYLEVYKKVGWDDFQKATIKVKNNIAFANFDAALGYIYRHLGVIDLVRIYTKNMSIEQFGELKDIYNGEIQRLE